MDVPLPTDRAIAGFVWLPGATRGMRTGVDDRGSTHLGGHPDRCDRSRVGAGFGCALTCAGTSLARVTSRRWSPQRRDPARVRSRHPSRSGRDRHRRRERDRPGDRARAGPARRAGRDLRAHPGQARRGRRASCARPAARCSPEPCDIREPAQVEAFVTAVLGELRPDRHRGQQRRRPVPVAGAAHLAERLPRGRQEQPRRHVPRLPRGREPVR